MRKRMMRAWVPAVATVCALCLSCLLLAPGCGGKSVEQRKEEYREEWETTMKAFDQRVTEDDQRVEQLVAEGEVDQIIGFIHDRMKSIGETETEILDLYPPDELRRLHALTLYYLETLLYQLDVQDQYYTALLEGSPTTDLSQKVQSLVDKIRGLGNELAIEVQKRGLSVNGAGADQEQQQEEQPTGEEEGKPQ